MKTVTGTINFVQEGRFELRSDEGQHKLFILSHHAPLEPQDLPDLQRRKVRVTVRFDEQPGLIAGIVKDMERAPEEPALPET